MHLPVHAGITRFMITTDVNFLNVKLVGVGAVIVRHWQLRSLRSFSIGSHAALGYS